MIVVLAAVFTACVSNDPAEQELALQQDVMDLHDKIMPKMGEFNKTKQKLMQVLFLAPNLDMPTREKLSEVAGNMGEVEESMMTWMNELQNVKLLRGEKKSHEFIMDYLNKEKAKIEKVGASMDGLTTAAQAAVDAHPVKLPNPASK